MLTNFTARAQYRSRRRPTTQINFLNPLIDNINKKINLSSMTSPTRPPAPTTCPVCRHELTVQRLHCGSCDTSIEGRFSRGRLARLNEEQLAFVEVFLESRGKIKDVEARLGVSYPTVVARLEQAVQALGPSAAVATAPSAGSSRVDAVLQALSRGELTPQRAAEQLRTFKAEPSNPDTDE